LVDGAADLADDGVEFGDMGDPARRRVRHASPTRVPV
jgi:hypothetical protein